MMEEVKQSDHDLIVRIDERTKHLNTAIAGFVTRKEFNPVRNIVFSFVGILSIAVLGALLSLVIRQANPS